jgi:hypothetical protein
MQPVSREWISKHIPTATNTHATIGEPVSKQRIGKHTTVGVVGNGVFCLVHAEWFITKSSVERN